MGRKGERTRDHKPSATGTSPPASTAHDTPIGDSAADQATLLQRLPAAQAQDLLHRAGSVQGNRHAQQVAGAATIQRVPLLDDDMLDLVMNGVQAFSELAGAPVTGAPPPPPPAVPAMTPAALRPALGHLREAKHQVVGANPGVAETAVGARLNAEGPLGIAKLIFLGPNLVLNERLDRAYSAKAEWQAARPACKALVDRYVNTPGTSLDYAEQLQGLIARLDLEMTAEIPKLHDMLIQLTSPEEAEVARSVAEAKQAVSGFEKIVDHVGRASKVYKESEILWNDRQVKVRGLRGPVGPLTSSAATKNLMKEDLDKEDEAFLFDVSHYPPSANFEKGLAALKTVKSLVSYYESGKAIGTAMGVLDDERASAAAKAKAGVDIATNLATPVQETGSLLLKGSAEVFQYIGEARQRMGQYGTLHSRDPFLRQAAYLFDTAEGLRKWAGWFDKLEKVTGVLGIVSGALALVEGIGTDDVEGTIGGGLDVVTGIAGLAPGAAATTLGIGALQVKGMLEAVAQMSRSLQTIRNRDLRAAANLVADELNSAAAYARVFDDAWQEWAVRQGTTDQLEAGLAQQFGNSALRQVDPLQVALHNGLLRALQGGLSTYPVLIDEFCMPFGGTVATRALLHDLASRPPAGSTGELYSQADFLKGIIRPMAIGVSNLSMALAALDREAKGKVEFAESARNTLHVKGFVSFGPDGTVSIGGTEIEFEGPIDDQKYKDSLSLRSGGKALNQVRAFDIEIEARVMQSLSGYESARLRGSDHGLARYEGMDRVIERLVFEAREEDESLTEDVAAKRIWNACMNKVTVPESVFTG